MATILYYAEEGESREVLARRLRMEEFEVIEECCDEAVLESARASRPNLILLNADDPSVDGWSVARQLSQDSEIRDIPVLMLISDVGVDTEEKCKSVRAIDFAARPIDIEVLLAKINAHLRQTPASGTPLVNMEPETEDENAIRILVVDDEDAYRELLKRRLSVEGFHVTVKDRGSLALEILEKEQFNLVLLDVTMPEMSGYEVLDEIRKKYTAEELPVIMVTSLSRTSDAVEAIERGANGYTCKPIDIASLLVQVNELLEEQS
jgi:DNA-binding response OmpR family regulator